MEDEDKKDRRRPTDPVTWTFDEDDIEALQELIRLKAKIVARIENDDFWRKTKEVVYKFAIGITTIGAVFVAIREVLGVLR